MISLFCPSRGRPQAARELLDSFLATKTTDAKLVFCLDNDDPTVGGYPPLRSGLDYIVGPPSGDPTGPLNHAALISTSDIVGFCGDDSRMETPGWDWLVAAALREPGFCWAWDGNQIPWPSTCFVNTEIVKALGYFALPTLHRGFFDIVWLNLAGAWHDDFGWRFPPGNCARILDEVVFKHDNSKGVVAPEVIAADEKAYHDWFRDGGYKRDRRKVIGMTDLARFFPTTV